MKSKSKSTGISPPQTEPFVVEGKVLTRYGASKVAKKFKRAGRAESHEATYAYGTYDGGVWVSNDETGRTLLLDWADVIEVGITYGIDEPVKTKGKKANA